MKRKLIKFAIVVVMVTIVVGIFGAMYIWKKAWFRIGAARVYLNGKLVPASSVYRSPDRSAYIIHVIDGQSSTMSYVNTLSRPMLEGWIGGQDDPEFETPSFVVPAHNPPAYAPYLGKGKQEPDLPEADIVSADHRLGFTCLIGRVEVEGI